ncbi:developmental pluripotency-associated protein 3-like [Suricata suricatta]|uniref:developmental pluripotency-associated protein 3-like n=1 Tax=Suricata suricatta TaxID=37032 RepID=UPI00115683BF|nr:developmental pluripotency-associated protein 3-like [Suricata suricatta]
MDSPTKLYPSCGPEPSQMASEENSQGASAASRTNSEVLVKNLRELTLNPAVKLPSPLSEYPSQEEREKKPQGLVDRILSNRRRTGVRTVLSAWKERMERLLWLVINHRYVQQPSKDEARVERFRCRCHYCLYHKDPSEDASMEIGYDMESL